MGEAEKITREALHGILGPGYIRGLHVLPRDSLKDDKEEDEDMGEVPDFADLIKDGMTVEDRLEQFQYLTEEDGSFTLDEDGNKVPRGQLPVRKYASDPNGPLAELNMPEAATVGFLDFDKVLDLLVRAEKKLYGLGGKKPSKKQQAAREAVKNTTEQEEKQMPAAKPRIMLRRPAAAGGGSKPDKTPQRVADKVGKAATTKKKTGKKTGIKKASPTGVKKTAPAEVENGEAENGASGIDLAAFEAIVEDKVAEATKALDEKLDAILAAIGEGPGGRSVSDTITDGLTATHDALQQKISNVYFGMLTQITEEGEVVPPEGTFLFLEPDDGRDRAQNLLEGDNPTNVISFYLDGEGDSGDDDEGEEDAEE